MCFNWKVLAGLSAAGVAFYLVRPDLAWSALPLLLMAACPLSMLFMGKSMAGHQPAPASGAAAGGAYTCPMHPDVRSDQPGRCPRCGMTLVPAAGQAAAQPRPSLMRATVEPEEEEVARLRGELAGLTARQAELARQLEQIDGTRASSKALQEAEEVARAAESRR